MEPFKPLDAVAAPLPVPNIDTDQIIPARFLWRKRGDGWGHLLFHDLRFDDGGCAEAGVRSQPAANSATRASSSPTATSAAAPRASTLFGHSTTLASGL